MENLKFWETEDWIKLKTSTLKTEEILSRVEYLRLVGWENYSDEKYKQYLEAMTEQEGEERE